MTTDTQFCLEEFAELYERADIIFHDCETAKVPSGVHAHYQELLTLPERVKSKMWLYGYQPGSLPDANKDGFRGFVKRGQIFDFSDLLPFSRCVLKKPFQMAPIADHPVFHYDEQSDTF